TVNFTQDSARIPAGPAGPALAFGTPLTTGRVGPFLTALAPPPPPGFVGNPAAPQTVTGSPCGQNIFSIQGPGLPGGGLQTDQFTVLIGKIAHVCGDGNVCTTDTCDPVTGCVNTPNTLPCDDLNPCTSGDTCAAGACVGTPNTQGCDDGNACTTADRCAGGACVGGPPPDCDDGNGCTS